MGGGKETPRQKMIGMMYLVLTALLAMNVSKQVLKGYIAVNDSMEASKKNLTENNKRIFEAFKASINANKAAQPYLEQAIISQKSINETYKYIDDLKIEIIKATEGYDNATADTAKLKSMEKMSDYDMASHILIGSDVANLSTGKWSAKELRGKLDELSDKLVKQLDGMQKSPETKLLDDDYNALKKKLISIKPVDTGEQDNGITLGWEAANFYHLPEAAIITNFNKTQSDLKNVEAEILNYFSAASGKLAIKFDQIVARVIAPSSYIQSGQSYEANIFLAASSSRLSDGDMNIYLGVDSLQASKGSTGSNKVEIIAGEGQFKVVTSAVGEQKQHGVIKYKNPDGTFKFYPFEFTYMVAPPSVAIEPEKMNVFYIGVPNPINISAAGVAPTELVVTASGAGSSISGGVGGKYELTCTTQGECLISVSAKTKDGVKPQGSPKKFRVKKIPDPVAKVGGKTGDAIFKKAELSTIGGVGTDLGQFDFDVKFVVVSFDVSAVIKGGIKIESCTGNSLNSGAQDILRQAQVGAKIWFDNVKCKGPDGLIRSINGVTIKVK